MKKPKYVPPVKIVDSRMAYVSESGKPYFLDDFNKASDAKRAAMLDNRSATEIIATLQANEETE